MKRFFYILTLLVLCWSQLQANPPNVLFIILDDQNDWIHALGHPHAKTPNIDRLAKRGTLFLNAHCQAPLCNPSRTSLLLGKRPSSTGVYALRPWFRNVESLKDSVTLPQAFKAQGYKTFVTGKVFHGDPGGPKKRIIEFDEWGPPSRIGPRPQQKLIPPTPMGNHPLMDWGTFEHRDEDKGDSLVANWVIEKLQETPNDEPFFLAAGFSLPHVPCFVSPKWFQLYPENESLLPPVQANDREDTPRFSWYLHWKLPEPRLKWVKEQHQWLNLVRSYLASTSFVDAQIGRILDTLEASGKADNTVIVFTSDNGFHLGEKGITGKNTLWERSTRVPLIFAGPGIEKNSTSTQPAELIDIYPTLLDLCHLPTSPTLEGLSLKPQLQDSKTQRERPAITTHNWGNHAIRSEQFRYIQYADGSEELYDLQQDPNEFHNLVQKPEFAKIISQHRQWLPKLNAAPVPGSLDRLLTYDKATDTAIWEGQPVTRQDAIPE